MTPWQVALTLEIALFYVGIAWMLILWVRTDYRGNPRKRARWTLALLVWPVSLVLAGPIWLIRRVPRLGRAFAKLIKEAELW